MAKREPVRLPNDFEQTIRDLLAVKLPRPAERPKPKRKAAKKRATRRDSLIGVSV